jgi:hypothetical protein
MVKTTRPFSEEFKREAVQVARRPDSSVAQVAKARQDDLTDDYVALREMEYYEHPRSANCCR